MVREATKIERDKCKQILHKKSIYIDFNFKFWVDTENHRCVQKSMRKFCLHIVKPERGKPQVVSLSVKQTKKMAH
jgi:hypothetical protein